MKVNLMQVTGLLHNLESLQKQIITLQEKYNILEKSLEACKKKMIIVTSDVTDLQADVDEVEQTFQNQEDVGILKRI
jgi:chromosome segregation ATPase